MAKYTYFISNFVPVLVALIIIWRNNTALLKKILPILILLGCVGLLNALAENPALHWGIWNYNKPKTLGITIFDVLFETYIYCILVPITIGSAAIKFADRIDRSERNARKKR